MTAAAAAAVSGATSSTCCCRPCCHCCPLIWLRREGPWPESPAHTQVQAHTCSIHAGMERKQRACYHDRMMLGGQQASPRQTPMCQAALTKQPGHESAHPGTKQALLPQHNRSRQTTVMLQPIASPDDSTHRQCCCCCWCCCPDGLQVGQV